MSDVSGEESFVGYIAAATAYFWLVLLLFITSTDYRICQLAA